MNGVSCFVSIQNAILGLLLFVLHFVLLTSFQPLLQSLQVCMNRGFPTLATSYTSLFLEWALDLCNTTCTL